MNILYISPDDPTQTDFGGRQRNNFMYQALCSIANVYTIVPVWLKKHEEQNDDLKIKWSYLNKRHTLGWVIQRFVHKLFPLIEIPYYFSTKDIGKHVFPNIKFDYVVVRYLRYVSFTFSWKIAPVWVDVDDDPVEVFNTLYAPKITNRLYKKIYGYLINKWMTWMLGKCRGGWVSNRQQVSTKLVWLPNIAKKVPENFLYSTNQEPFLFTVGLMNHPPNTEGIDYFLENYWESILLHWPNLSYYIIGAKLSDNYYKKWTSYGNVKVLGFVQNIEPFYEKCLASLAPIYSGSGTCIKVLESLSRGRICITTPFGARGIPQPEQNIMNGVAIYHNMQDMLNILSLLSDINSRIHAQTTCINYFHKNYSFNSFVNIIKTSLLKIG